MNNQEISKMKDEELVKLAGGTVIGTPSGLKAQHAQAELSRRLMNAITELNATSSKYSGRLIQALKDSSNQSRSLEKANIKLQKVMLYLAIISTLILVFQTLAERPVFAALSVGLIIWIIRDWLKEK